MFPHIKDKLDFRRDVLVRVVGFKGAVKTTFPAVDILLAGFILDGSFGNPIFLSVFNK